MSRVFVGMSGGVDSSLTAALLVEAGHEVTGVYMKNWTEDLPGMRCPWADDLADAKRVAVQLGIPFKVYDFQAEYKQRVVDYMIGEYQAGRTPNPDVMCNQEVKFKLFLEAALADGAEMIATGHYARVVHGLRSGGADALFGAGPLGANGQSVLPRSAGKAEPLPNSASAPPAGVISEDRTLRGSGWPAATASSEGTGDSPAGADARLLKAVDQNKDQTYFLYRVTSSALAKTLFPLGEFQKTEVRRMAEERGLVTAAKRDSQGICFVGSVGIKEFLSQYVTAQPGEIIERETGVVVGHHDGAIYYTLGQRHGLGVGGGLPYYVTSKDMEHNVLYVSRNLNDESMWRHELPLTQIHWINQPPGADDVLHVRLRHRGALLPVKLAGDTLQLEHPERSVAPGQSAVIYRGDEVLGGGIVS